MWQNPINFLFFLGILFWVPQIQMETEQLEKDHHLLEYLTSQKIPTKAASVGALKLSAQALPVANSKEPCLFSQLEVASSAVNLKKGDLLFTKSHFASSFELKTNDSQNLQTVLVENKISPEVLIQPKAENLKIIPSEGPLKSETESYAKTWGVQEPETLAYITEAYKVGSAQVRCLNYGSTVLATGYLTAENKIAYTVTSPFTISFANEPEVIEAIYAEVSHLYLESAFIVMMMVTLGLAIFTNAALRSRITLPFESIDLKSLPWSSPKAPDESETSFWARRLGIRAQAIHYENFGLLPSFYRYQWEDGLTLYGRKVYFIVHESGITLLEISPKSNNVNGAHHAPKAWAEVAWTDLHCVYFTKINDVHNWLDIVARNGERYQIMAPENLELKITLKRWDATEILNHESTFPKSDTPAA